VAVKRSRSASRVLAALEGIARHQPIGVSELARQLGADKSATQRAIMTLADDGWIRTSPGTPTRWQLTGHILAVAHIAHGSHDLRQRARGALEDLRDESGETVLLTVPDIRHFVVIDVVESRQFLRSVPHIGMIVPVQGSATSRAVLPFLDANAQIELLGEAPDKKMLEHFARTRERGYSVSEGDVAARSTNLAAPIFEMDGRPVGAVVLSAPSDRIGPKTQPKFGAMLLRTARALSRGGTHLDYAKETKREDRRQSVGERSDRELGRLR
jgi:IclR family acetate operon transcriptional repressor